MVDIHHYETCQSGGTLLAPGALPASLRLRLVKHRLKDKGRQLTLQRCIMRLTILVDVLVPLRSPDERPELGLVNRQRRITEILLIAKHNCEL